MIVVMMVVAFFPLAGNAGWDNQPGRLVVPIPLLHSLSKRDDKNHYHNNKHIENIRENKSNPMS